MPSSSKSARRLVHAVAAFAMTLAVVATGAIAGPAPTASAWAEQPMSHHDADGSACADVLFVGVRGSGEESGYGAPIEQIRDGVEHGYGIYPGVGDARTVREVYLDYPAAPVSAITDDLTRNLQNAVAGIPRDQWVWGYLDSIDAGARSLTDFLSAESVRCPHEKWVLAGYSQGALVVNMVLPAFADYARYGGVFLLANPGRHSGDAVLDLGTAPADGWGIGTLLWPELEVPAVLRGLVYSECDAYDAVCDAGNLIQSVVAGERGVSQGAADGLGVHTGYQAAVLQLDSRHIVEQLMGMPVPLQDAYEITVSPGEAVVGSVDTKPLRDGVTARWSIAPGTSVPPGTVTDVGILLGADGAYIVQVPEGEHRVQLRAVGEFDDHARSVTLTIRAGKAWQPVVFEDAGLELCIRAEFQVMARLQAEYPWLYPDYVEPARDKPLLPADLRHLIGLTCAGITSLEGIQWATELGSLNLTETQIDDLSPLAELSKLYYLTMSGGSVHDLSPLAGLTALATLELSTVPVKDVSPLAGLHNMLWLTLNGTDVVDLTPLAGMTKMDGLNVSGNPRLADVSTLASMPDLRVLYLRENPLLTSLAPLSALTKVEHLDLWDADLASLDGVQNMTQLTYLQASRNRIVSIAPLQNLAALRQVHLDGNAIVNLGPLAGKTALQHLDLVGNAISDLAPLADLPALSTLIVAFNRITDLSMFAGNTTVRTVSASLQRIDGGSRSVGDSVTLPVFRTQDGAVLTPWFDDATSDATATLTGDPATGVTLTWTGPGYSVVRWEDPAGYFEGEYVVRAAAEPEPGGGGEGGDPPPGIISRWSGGDRYATSAAISAKTFTPGVPVAFIANGANFPDALSGAAVAGMDGGPVLLTQAGAIPESVKNELTRLMPAEIVILGGAGVVTEKVAAQLRSYTSGAVSRWSGSDRYATSAAISAKAFDPGVTVAFIANGMNFPDALSGAAIAGRDDGPVLLTQANAIPEAVKMELARLKPGAIVILGGAGVVTEKVASQLRSYTTGAVARWSGGDRYATSAAISARAFEPEVPVVFVANGLDFPDALSGAAAAGIEGGPVLLTQSSAIPTAIKKELTRLKPTRVVILGGAGVVTDAVAAQLRAYATG